MSKRYTLTECYELLQADPKTFRHWLKKAGMHEQVKNQVSKADEPVRYLTHEQLEELATLNDRSLSFVTNSSLIDHFDLPEIPSQLVDIPHKKISHKSSSSTLIADQLQELLYLYQQTAELAHATHHAISEQETRYQWSLESLRTVYNEKISELEKTIEQQKQHYDEQSLAINDQLKFLEHYKDDFMRQSAIQNDEQVDQIEMLEVSVAQCQQALERGLEDLRHTLSTKDEQVHGIVKQLQQGVEALFVDQQKKYHSALKSSNVRADEQIVHMMELINSVVGNIEIFEEKHTAQDDALALLRSDLRREAEERQLLAQQIEELKAQLQAAPAKSSPRSSRSRSTRSTTPVTP